MFGIKNIQSSCLPNVSLNSSEIASYFARIRFRKEVEISIRVAKVFKTLGYKNYWVTKPREGMEQENNIIARRTRALPAFPTPAWSPQLTHLAFLRQQFS